ncbi:MAG: signal peptide peptidase SppA [Desulfatitalea sp.]|nr:signal peptide peptidase SppA [Desulfatitalea sp.]NNJ99347.1 signal peptide peptidase SppA [Desulfatitalea sp.]
MKTHNNRLLIFTAILALLSASACSLPKVTLFGGTAQPLQEITLQGKEKGKVLVLNVEGIISSMPRRQFLRSEPSMVQQVAAYLKHAEKDPDIKALLLKVDSPGGSVTASDIIYHEISGYKSRTGVKVVVAMMNVAASGGYYISLPADHIMCHPTTITGSIGVIFMHTGVNDLMDKVGVRIDINKSGKQKDMGSPFRKPTPEEEAIFQGLTDNLADRFLDLVEQHRRLDPEQRRQIETARVYLPEKAKALGLVDQIGYLDDAIDKAKALAGLPGDARVIAYRRQPRPNDTIYNPTAVAPSGDLTAMLPLMAPLSTTWDADFYYIWPAAMGR